MLKTTLAGRLPKPAWLADPGHQLFAPWVPPSDRLGEAQDDAVRLAISDQEDAGLDIVSDGEQRRRHYIWRFLYSYGIPRVLAWKRQNREWGQYGVTLPLLRETRIDQISLECAASGVDVAVLGEARGKDVLLGVIDVGTEEIESPELVATRIRKALPYVDPGRLFPCTDCGLVPRTRPAARGKLRALVEGAQLVRRELGT
jgi:methionine synthase II (cobalamin-independent)